MGSDQPEDDEESTSINIDASLISEITITRTGMAPITAYADTASPADNEPSTLEPQLVVRGLAAYGPSSSSAPPPPTFAEVGGRQDSESEYGPEEERTTQNLESHVQAAYDRAIASAPQVAAPKTQLSPILLTPSEPIRLDAVRGAFVGPKPARRPAPIPAAGRPPEQDLDRESAVTAKRGPEKVESLGASAVARPFAETEDDYEEETKTDAVQSELVAASRERAEMRPVPQVEQHPAMEPDETRTKKAPLTMMSAQAAFMMEDPPRREPVPVEPARSDLDAQAAAGGTVRMFFNPTTGQVAAHPESEHVAVAQHSMQPFGEQPTVQALPIQQNPVMGAPVVVRNPALLDETHGLGRKPRRVLPLVVLFLIACAASGAAVHFRDQLGPRINALLPADWRSPRASVAPDPSASTAVVSAAVVASAAAAPSAGPVPAPPSTGTAPTSAAASASSASAGASAAAASASAQHAKNKRFPPKK